MAIDPLTAAKLWMLFRPIRTWKEHRAAKRAARKAESDAAGGEFLDFDEETTMTIDLGTRTSTNALVGGGLFTTLYIQGVQLIPGEGALEMFLLQPEATAFAALVFATIVARFTKTPAKPGVV